MHQCCCRRSSSSNGCTIGLGVAMCLQPVVQHAGFLSPSLSRSRSLSLTSRAESSNFEPPLSVHGTYSGDSPAGARQREGVGGEKEPGVICRCTLCAYTAPSASAASSANFDWVKLCLSELIQTLDLRANSLLIVVAVGLIHFEDQLPRPSKLKV